MKKCPSCEKRISEYSSTRPNCKFNLAKDTEPDRKWAANSSVKKSVTLPKRNITTIAATLLAIVVIAIVFYLSQPLHGDDRVAYDLISNCYLFRNAQTIEVLNGSVGTKSGSGKKFACLTIAYTNSPGDQVVGHYEIIEYGVTDLIKAMDEAKNIIDNTNTDWNDSEAMAAWRSAKMDYQFYEASLAASNSDHELNYDKITRELNK